MNIVIKTDKGSMSIWVAGSDRVEELIEIIVKHFNLPEDGTYGLGKQNHVFVEFGKSYTLEECGVVEGDQLIFTEYNSSSY